MHPTGEQYEITLGAQRAVITEVGATLRRYQVDGRDLINGFGATELVTGGRGQNLIPWPNRIRDGRYRFEGRDLQLALTEPARHNASHGLARYVPWTVLDHQPSRVSLRVRIYPQTGWPGTLEAVISYELTERRAGGAGPGQQSRRHSPALRVRRPSLSQRRRVRGRRGVGDRAGRLAISRSTTVCCRPRSRRSTGPRTICGPVRCSAHRNLDVAMTGLDRDPDGRWRVVVAHGDRRTRAVG